MPCSRILLVEDEAMARESMKMLLELEGFEVATATNGHEALHLLTEIGQPCLIVLDLMMPVMSGWEFLQVIREGSAPPAANAPIVIISAAADSIEAQSLKDYPLLKKPFDIESLLHEVWRHCRTN